MKKLLLLGGSEQQIIAIDTAKQLGLYTILCDYLPDNSGQYHADRFYPVSTTDKEAILNIALKEKINGIIAYASDPAAPTAAYVAEKMGLPTNPYSSVEILCNKDLFRDFLKANGFNVPFSKGYSDKYKAMEDAESLDYPIIIKPVDSSGSKGITVLSSNDGIEEAVEFAFSFSRKHRIIIEKYIVKAHPFLIGGDIFVLGGKVVLWGLMNCHRDLSVNSLVPAGKTYPPLLNENKLDAIKETLQKMITALDIRFGPMNVELIVDQDNRVFPIDIGPRGGGNMIPDLLGMIFDCDLVDMSIRCAIGQNIVKDMYVGKGFFATYNLHSYREGILNKIEYSPEIMKYMVKERLYKKSGDIVHYFSNAADALGILFFKFPDQETMIDMEEHMNEYIRVILEGDL